MANKYLIGTGARNWNDVANWSETSGGAGGASVPTSADVVILDANSGTGTITLNADANCLSFDASALGSAITIAGPFSTFNCYGSFTGNANLTFTLTGTSYFYSKGTGTITQGGATLNWNRWYIDASGGTVTHDDDFTAPSVVGWVSNGTLDTNNKNISIQRYYVVGTATVNLGASILTLIGWQFTTGTLNSGTSLIKIVGTGNFLGGGQTYYDIEYTNDSYPAIGSQTTARNVTVNSGLNITSSEFRIDAGLTVTGILTIVGANDTNYRCIVYSNTIGIPRTITVNGSIVASNVDFRDIVIAGTAAPFDASAITGGSGDCGGNSGIVFTPAQPQYFKNVVFRNLIQQGDSRNFNNGLGRWYSQTNGAGTVVYDSEKKCLKLTQVSSGYYNYARYPLVQSLPYTTYRFRFRVLIESFSGSTFNMTFNDGTDRMVVDLRGLERNVWHDIDANVTTGNTTSVNIDFRLNSALAGSTVYLDDISVEEIGSYAWSDSQNWFSDQALTTAGRVPLPQDDANFIAGSFDTACTLSVNVPSICGLNMDGVNKPVIMTLAGVISCYGDLRTNSNIFFTESNNVLWLRNRNEFVYVYIYNHFNNNLYWSAPTGIVTFLHNYASTKKIGLNVNWTDSSFDFNDYDITFDYFAVHGGGGIRKFGNGVITINTGYFYAGGIIGEGSTLRVLDRFVGAIDKNYFNKVELLNSTDIEILQNNSVGTTSIKELILYNGKAYRFSGQVNGYKKFYIDKLTAIGTPEAPITITSTTTTPFKLVKTGEGLVNVENCNISYSNASPANRFFAMDSVDGGNNTGWNFGQIGASPGDIAMEELEAFAAGAFAECTLSPNFSETELLGCQVLADVLVLGFELSEAESMDADAFGEAVITPDFVESEIMDADLKATALASADFVEHEQAGDDHGVLRMFENILNAVILDGRLLGETSFTTEINSESKIL